MRGSISFLIRLVALAALIMAPRFIGHGAVASTALFTACWAAMVVADIASSRRWLLLVDAGLLAAWLALLARAAHLPR